MYHDICCKNGTPERRYLVKSRNTLAPAMNIALVHTTSTLHFKKKAAMNIEGSRINLDNNWFTSRSSVLWVAVAPFTEAWWELQDLTKRGSLHWLQVSAILWRTRLDKKNACKIRTITGRTSHYKTCARLVVLTCRTFLLAPFELSGPIWTALRRRKSVGVSAGLRLT
jgi:hypothetical protein